MALYRYHQISKNSHDSDLKMPPIIHGHTKRGTGKRTTSAEYRAYASMKNRCLNENQKRYEDYGGRGIGVCPQWLYGNGALSGFECFLRDVGPKPTPKHSLDRIENDQGYRAGNVQWATRKQQASNKRNSKVVDVCGCPITLTEATERWGVVSVDLARMRVWRGWSPDDAIWTPIGGKPGKVGLPWPFDHA